MKNNAFTFGPVIITTTNQACGAPVFDRGWSNEKVTPFRRWKGWAILLTPWRRNQYGETRPQRALFIGLVS